MAKKTSPFDGVTRLYWRTEPIKNRKGVIVDHDPLPDVIRVEHADGIDYYIRGEGDDMALTRLPDSQIAGAEAEFASADTAKRERKAETSPVLPDPPAPPLLSEQSAEAVTPDRPPFTDTPGPKKARRSE